MWTGKVQRNMDQMLAKSISVTGHLGWHRQIGPNVMNLHISKSMLTLCKFKPLVISSQHLENFQPHFLMMFLHVTDALGLARLGLLFSA